MYFVVMKGWNMKSEKKNKREFNREMGMQKSSSMGERRFFQIRKCMTYLHSSYLIINPTIMLMLQWCNDNSSILKHGQSGQSDKAMNQRIWWVGKVNDRICNWPGRNRCDSTISPVKKMNWWVCLNWRATPFLLAQFVRSEKSSKLKHGLFPRISTQNMKFS